MVETVGSRQKEGRDELRGADYRVVAIAEVQGRRPGEAMRTRRVVGPAISLYRKYLEWEADSEVDGNARRSGCKVSRRKDSTAVHESRAHVQSLMYRSCPARRRAAQEFRGRPRCAVWGGGGWRERWEEGGRRNAASHRWEAPMAALEASRRSGSASGMS
jgi:hypothetical protein